jgi:hypothetical protein
MTPSQIQELRYYARRVLSERHEREGKCMSKTAYASRSDAERAMRRVTRRAGVEAFRCAYCNQWHLGARGVR